MSGRTLVWVLLVAGCPRPLAAQQPTTLELRLVRAGDTASIPAREVKAHLRCARGGTAGEISMTSESVRCVVPASAHGTVEVTVDRAPGYYPETVEARRRGAVWQAELTPRFELLGQIFLNNDSLKSKAKVICHFQTPEPDSTSDLALEGQYRCRDPGSARGAIGEISVAVSQVLARTFHQQVAQEIPCEGEPGGERCVMRRTFDVYLKLK